MTTIKRFEDLECWQEARKFVKMIYKLINKPGFCQDKDLVGQIRRSSISSMSNISEGFHRNSTRDFMKFLDYSRSSIAESVSHCYVALDQEYISEKELKDIKNQADLVWKKVNSFISYLNRTLSDKPNRTNSTNRTNKTNKTNKTNETNETNETNSTN
jgi:four helix bundle protein